MEHFQHIKSQRRKISMNIIQAIQNMSSNLNQLKRWIDRIRTSQDVVYGNVAKEPQKI